MLLMVDGIRVNDNIFSKQDTIRQDGRTLRIKPGYRSTSGRKVREKRLIVCHAASLEEAHTCHVLYIAVSEQENMAKIYEASRNSSILTATDFNAPGL